MEPRIGIVYSNRLKELACLSPKYGHRFSLVMALIHAYKMTEHLVRIPPVNLTPDAELKYLSSFHSHDFLESLRLLDGYYADDADPDIPDDVMDSLEEYGLAYDCQGFPGVYDYALSAVRATLAAVDALLNRKCQVAINWAGGWHHGKRAEASGFCYLNDVVIGLNYLLSSAAFQDSRKRVIYLDFDLHHGDGVEEAFAYSSRVVTFSVHHASPGFFPGTGDITPDSSGFFTGARGGRYSCFNLPLAEGTGDETWLSTVKPILSALHASLQPSFIVVQCGADGLTSDPHRVFNLSVDQNCAHAGAVRQVLSWGLPTLLLGGGGYHFPDTARLWALLTSITLSAVRGNIYELPDDIPDHPELISYGPDYSLSVTSSMCQDKNSEAVLKDHVDRLLKQLKDFCDTNDLTFAC
ncbi:unnamed protein product [Schistocephalus solidus]|uniref:Histone deacetylase n=1 Tax=Schistocephalus solidus TaxID=70667 RepID=A0A183T7Z4_SCHSO|nr:unnamed protein product [Schistocephalus solidus]